jgi:hypothetical protein
MTCCILCCICYSVLSVVFYLHVLISSKVHKIIVVAPKPFPNIMCNHHHTWYPKLKTSPNHPIPDSSPIVSLTSVVPFHFLNFPNIIPIFNYNPIVIVSSAAAATGAAIIMEIVCFAVDLVFVFVVFDFVVLVLLDTLLPAFVVAAVLVVTATLVLEVSTGITLLELLSVDVAGILVALAHCPHHGPLT